MHAPAPGPGQVETDAPAAAGIEEAKELPDSEPWRLSDHEWNSLEPKGMYARYFRTAFLYACASVATIPAVVIALPIALINAVFFGPRRVFFLQRRVGLRGEAYVMFKFRTMRDGQFASDEARVTPFGRFLRNTHFDELPQLINVLRGEMALIGPRPEMICIERWCAATVPQYSQRLVLRPGITGLAQITQGYTANGDRAAYALKLRINRSYRTRVSFARDVTILIGTVSWMLRRRGWRPRVCTS